MTEIPEGQHPVTIEFPNSLDGLVKVLDWLNNSGDFMELNMSDEVIQKAIGKGIKVTRKESQK